MSRRDKKTTAVEEKPKGDPVTEETKEQASPVAEGETKPTEENSAGKSENPTEPQIVEMPLGYCMDESAWAKEHLQLFDPNGICETCKKENPDLFPICEARALQLQASIGKKKRASGSVKVRKDGQMPETLRIDALLKEGADMETLVGAIASEYYSGEVAPAKSRVSRHINAIRKGTYVRSEEVRAYVVEEPAQPDPAQPTPSE